MGIASGIAPQSSLEREIKLLLSRLAQKNGEATEILILCHRI
jgi:hypothetical protein